MRRPVGTAAVRLSLWMLLFAALVTSLLQPTSAGTPEAPEIQDPAGDHEVLALAPPCVPQAGCQFGGMDIVSVWIDAETETQFNVNILLSAAPGPNNQYVNSWTFHATVAGTEVTAGATTVAGAGPAGPNPTGATSAVTVDGNTLILTVPRSAMAGPTLEGIFADSARDLFTVGETIVSDTAPNDGAAAGIAYSFGGPGGPPSCPNCTADDTDGDGLNDTWEQEYFGNLTQNATGDPDGDGLTNGQEQALGTDPTNPDTDGDGVNDKDDPFPLDPTRGGTNTTTTTSSSSTSRSSTSASASVTATTTGGGTGDDSDESRGTCADTDATDAVDCLTTDVGYLGMSAGGFLAVLILCIIALATRWSL